MASRTRNQGQLESQILGVLWDSQTSGTARLTSQEVLDLLAPDGSLALTTVLTVLSRLVDKGLVVRQPGAGRSLLFSAATSREQHDAALLLKVFEGSQNPLLAFSHFADSLTPQQLAQLQQSLNRN